MRQSSGDHDPGVYVDLDGAPLGDLSVPEPVPYVHAHLRERRICLSRSTKSLCNFVADGRSARRSAAIDHLPVRLDFENVSRCNFACTMCSVSEWPKGRRAQDVPLDRSKRIVDEQYGLVEIKFKDSASRPCRALHTSK